MAQIKENKAKPFLSKENIDKFSKENKIPEKIIKEQVQKMEEEQVEEIKETESMQIRSNSVELTLDEIKKYSEIFSKHEKFSTYGELLGVGTAKVLFFLFNNFPCFSLFFLSNAESGSFA